MLSFMNSFLPGVWSKVFGGLILTILTAFFWFSFDWVKAVNALPEKVSNNTKAIEQMGPKLDQIIGLLEEHMQRAMTITGKVKIVENGHIRGSMIWVNESSSAAVYANLKEVYVTNLGSNSRRKIPIEIAGSINTADDIIGEICSSAAIALSASGGDSLQVRLEPVPNDKVN